MLGIEKVERLELMDSTIDVCWCEPKGSDTMKVWRQLDALGWIFIAEYSVLSYIFLEKFIQEWNLMSKRQIYRKV
jgi:hypothetical protein